MDIEERVERLEKHAVATDAWQRNAEVTEARRVANEAHLDKRLDQIEASMATGFTGIADSIDKRFKPFDKIAWMAVMALGGTFCGVVANFALSGGFNVGN